jgi:addiction module RelE/StbE family toxin
MKIQYSDKAVKQLKKLCRGEKKSAKMIVDSIERYAEDPSGNFDVKVLKGAYGDFKRLRVGNYRVIFEVIRDVLYIYEINHRQGAYK